MRKIKNRIMALEVLVVCFVAVIAYGVIYAPELVAKYQKEPKVVVITPPKEGYVRFTQAGQPVVLSVLGGIKREDGFVSFTTLSGEAMKWNGQILYWEDK